jgi:hypothetical protein
MFSKILISKIEFNSKQAGLKSCMATCSHKSWRWYAHNNHEKQRLQTKKAATKKIESRREEKWREEGISFCEMPVAHRLLLSCNLDLSDFRINCAALHQLMPVEQGIREKTALPQLPSPNQTLILVRPCSWGTTLEEKKVFVLVARAFFWSRQVTKFSKK